MDLNHRSIKAIQYENAVYILDIAGNVGKYVGGGGLNTLPLWKNCTDIFVTDALYARQFSVDNEGKLANKVIKLANLSDGVEQKDFSVSSCLSQFREFESFFSQAILMHDHLLCVHGSTMYIRKENQSKWLDRIDFGHNIIDLLPIGGEKDDVKILCVTKVSVEILTLNK